MELRRHFEDLSVWLRKSCQGYAPGCRSDIEKTRAIIDEVDGMGFSGEPNRCLIGISPRRAARDMTGTSPYYICDVTGVALATAGGRACRLGPWSMAKVEKKNRRRDVVSHLLPKALDLLAGKSAIQTFTVLILRICQAAMRLKKSCLASRPQSKS